jgi:hypothetical protein
MTLQFDGMKRTIAAILMLLLLVPALPPVLAVQTREHWDADSTLRAHRSVPAVVDLLIGPGVNITFEPDLNALPFSPVYLDIGGGLQVCGTAESPVAFYASNESLFTQDTLGGYINIEGNGDIAQLAVQNCGFQNLVIILNGTAGRFRDCSFDTTFIYSIDSAVVFSNCSFVRSVVSILNPATLDRTRLSGCVFDSSTQDRWDPFWGYFDQVSAIKVSGYVAIDNCTISGYGTGIESSSGLPVITGCLVKDCQYGQRSQSGREPAFAQLHIERLRHRP